VSLISVLSPVLVLVGFVVWVFWKLRHGPIDWSKRNAGPRGFEVKQNPGTTPGAEEKDIDHG
jgi:flagellar biogenesis protein FliO